MEISAGKLIVLTLIRTRRRRRRRTTTITSDNFRRVTCHMRRLSQNWSVHISTTGPASLLKFYDSDWSHGIVSTFRAQSVRRRRSIFFAYNATNRAAKLKTCLSVPLLSRV